MQFLGKRHLHNRITALRHGSEHDTNKSYRCTVTHPPITIYHLYASISEKTHFNRVYHMDQRYRWTANRMC